MSGAAIKGHGPHHSQLWDQRSWRAQGTLFATGHCLANRNRKIPTYALYAGTGKIRNNLRLDEKRGSRYAGWEIQGLAASGPSPRLKEKLALFGQFVGDWDIVENRHRKNDGTWAKSRGRLYWRWILEGRAVQDVWTSVEDTGKEIPWGTTIRFYDPKIDAWQSTWISPRQSLVRTFIGRKVGDEIVLESTNSKEKPLRWIFSEITPDSFKWRGETSYDGGKTFLLEEVMRIRRQQVVA